MQKRFKKPICNNSCKCYTFKILTLKILQWLIDLIFKLTMLKYIYEHKQDHQMSTPPKKT